MALWRALVAGDDHRVGRLVPLLADLVALQARLDGFLAVEKHLLVRQGVLSSTVMQGPVAFELDAEMRSEVDRRFDALMAAVWQ
jgi:2-keto-3-deoxy-L-arabinonate dehydratase